MKERRCAAPLPLPHRLHQHPLFFPHHVHRGVGVGAIKSGAMPLLIGRRGDDPRDLLVGPSCEADASDL